MNVPSAKRASQLMFFLLFTIVAVVIRLGSEAAVQAAPKLAASIPNQQLAFERNIGQNPSQFQFVSHARNYAVFLESDEATLVFRAAEQSPILQNASVTKYAATTELVSLHLLQSDRETAAQAD
jgi:hypothetical protein